MEQSDNRFFDELRKTRRDYGIRKAKVTNDISRRRIAVIEISGVNKLR